MPQYEIPNSHEAIIPLEVWNLVQLEIERRQRLGSRYSGKGALGSRLVCQDCGAFYGAKVWHSNDPYRTVIFQCNDKFKPNTPRQSGGVKCSTPHVTEKELQQAFAPVCQRLLREAPEVIETCKTIVADLLDCTAIDNKLEKAKGEAKSLQERVQALVSERTKPVADEKARQQEFERRYAEMDRQYKKIEGSIAELEAQKDDRLYRARQCSVFMENLTSASSGLFSGETWEKGDRSADNIQKQAGSTLKQAGSKDKQFQKQAQENDWHEKGLFNALVENVIIGGKKGNPTFRFLLRNGREYPQIGAC